MRHIYGTSFDNTGQPIFLKLRLEIKVPLTVSVCSSLLRAIGNPIDSLQFASRCRSTYREETLENQSTLFGTPLVVRQRIKIPQAGHKGSVKPEFDE